MTERMAHLSLEPRPSVELSFCRLIPAAEKIHWHKVETRFGYGFSQAFSLFAACFFELFRRACVKLVVIVE